MEGQKYLTVEEAAEVFQVSEFTIRRWIKAGDLRAAKIGKSWRIKRDDLDAFYEKRAQAQEGMTE